MTVTNIVLFIILLIILFFIVVMAVDTHRLVVRKYSVSTPKIAKDYRIVLLSDLHSKSFGKNNIDLIEKIRKLNPDAVFVSGDMYTALKNDVGKTSLNLLFELSKNYPIYYSNGNHEQKTKELPKEFKIDYENYVNELSMHGVIYLDNESQYISEYGVKIYGLTLPFEYYRKTSRKIPSVALMNELMGIPNEECLNILLAHNPKYFGTYAKWGADITLSGHVHGGLMRLGKLGVISPDFKFFPKYSGGKYSADDSNKTMILSCGLGTHHIPVRIFNPGEISLVEIKKITT